MINTHDILETITMIDDEHLDVRTITMGISLLDCSDEDIDKVAAVIEEMAFQGYSIVTPEYYNVVLKQKYARDS